MDYLSTYAQRAFFNHLARSVMYIDSPDTYRLLFEKLHSIEFYAIHPMDENRAGDAISYRRIYTRECGADTELYDDVPSVFEVLVGIAKRMSYIFSSLDEDLTKHCFWHLVSNLGLAAMDDMSYADLGGDIAVDEIVDRWLSRSYDISGEGGLFPMARPRTNQREVEIFYQMNQYHSDPNGIEFKRAVSGGEL